MILKYHALGLTMGSNQKVKGQGHTAQKCLIAWLCS